MSMTEDKRDYIHTEISCPNCGEITEIYIIKKDDLLEMRGQPHHTFSRKTTCLKCGHELNVMLAVQDTHYGK
jgi:transcription elongation factor Elf1